MKPDLPAHVLGDGTAAVEMDVTLSQPLKEGWLKVRVAVRVPCDPSSLALSTASEYAFDHALTFASSAIDTVVSVEANAQAPATTAAPVQRHKTAPVQKRTVR